MDDRVSLPMPHGWFSITESEAIPIGEAVTLRAFGQDLVTYRGDDDRVRVVDPYCPHLGAHLGVGGRVIGRHLRCPFHHWAFDGDTGACVDIPYAEKIPPAARLRAWRVEERHGLVFVWHHPDAGEARSQHQQIGALRCRRHAPCPGPRRGSAL